MSCIPISDTFVCGKWSSQYINTMELSQIYGIPQSDFNSKTWESALLSDVEISQFNTLTGCKATNIQYYLSNACFNDIFVHSGSCNRKQAQPLCTSVCDSLSSSMDKTLSNQDTCPINFNVNQLLDQTLLLRDAKNCNSKNKQNIFLGQDQCLMGVGKDSSTCGFNDQQMFQSYCQTDHPCCKNVTVIPAGENKTMLPFSTAVSIILSVIGGLLVLLGLAYCLYRMYFVVYKKRNERISQEYFEKVDSDRFSIDDDKSLRNVPRTIGDNDSITPFHMFWDDKSLANQERESITSYKLELECIAKCDYNPRSVDELEIKKGERLTFDYLYDDGWGTAVKADGSKGLACLLIMELQGEDLSPTDEDFAGENSTLTTPDGINLHYISQFDYSAQASGHLSIKRGDHIILRKVRPDGWLEAYNVTSGQEGLTSHMLVTVDLPSNSLNRRKALEKITLPARSTSIAKESTPLIMVNQVEEQAKMFEKYSLLLRKRTTVKAFPFSTTEPPILATPFICRAKCDFVPRQQDELPLSKGDIVRFSYLYDDGWGKGTKEDGSAGLCCVILMDRMDDKEEDPEDVIDLALQYRVKINYKAQSPEQIDLEVGDVISLKRVLDSGWVQALNTTTGQQGTVSPIFLDVDNLHIPERISSNSEGSVVSQEQDMLVRSYSVLMRKGTKTKRQNAAALIETTIEPLL
ncbi:hypothetical protein HK103_001627 [Boothiomyces macroporosus]|uniref:SH3 domain-containing protein n=1 Tax=Boothiomyces macroporosus TaxID=261099 RepID=A0AAD5Y4T4_9FUNG|nr:hypothetical protein HK103_001627 [Boothiomyces macroporosus]